MLTPGTKRRYDAQRKPTLCIVSTFDDLCGIAGYTRFLAKQLEPHFDVDVFDLDQYFMRSPNYRVRKIADGMVNDFCTRARNGAYDAVNVQLEHGIFGERRRDITRRLTSIIRSAPRLSVTFHTILPDYPFMDSGVLPALARLRIKAAHDALNNWRHNSSLNRAVYGQMRHTQSSKPVSAIVHTRRDMRTLRYIHGIKNVYDHPLAFLDDVQAQRIRAGATRAAFRSWPSYRPMRS
ncbi:MAG: hypothetical protein HC834_03505 [Rhodospirillales bacterium]|nr:hypothetical protein [Rhodospirillales bacterium]